MAHGILRSSLIAERDIVQPNVKPRGFGRHCRFGQRRRSGKFLQTVYGLIRQEEILTEIHGLHYIGSYNRCYHDIEEKVGHDHCRVLAVAYQNNSCGHEEESKGIDSNGVGRHGYAPQEGIAADEVAIADDAVVEPFE